MDKVTADFVDGSPFLVFSALGRSILLMMGAGTDSKLKDPFPVAFL